MTELNRKYENKNYTKLWDFQLGIQSQKGFLTQAKGKSGMWHNARPEQYHSFLCRIRDAWNVLWSRADALYWTIDEDK